MRINSPYITGSATITGNLCVQGTILGTITGVASTASYAETLDGLDSTQFVQTGSFNSYTSSASSSIGSLSGSVATTTSGLSSSIGSLSSSVATTTSGLSSSIGSLSSSVATTTSGLSSSVSSSIGSLSGSVATTTSGLAGRIGTIEGNYATTGSNTFVGSQVITGSLYITNDMIVQGCSCLQNITASAVSIGTNTVVLNTATPAVRFAGVSVQDSGSNAGVTGSIYWDGLCNRWIYSNPSDIGYSGGMLMSGPRTSTLGTESPLTCNYIAKSGGGDHLYDSCIIDDGTTVCINANLKGSGTISGTNIYGSTAVCSVVGKFTTCIDAGSGTFSGGVTGGTITSNLTNGLILLRDNGTAQAEVNIRHTSTRNGVISFTENGVADRWAIGTKPSDGTLYFSANFDLSTPKLTISSVGVTCFSGTVCAPSLSIGCTTNSTNPSVGSIISAGGLGLGGDIFMHPYNANQSNYGYIKTAATTVNTTTLTLGTTYGYATNVDAVSFFNGSATFNSSVTLSNSVFPVLTVQGTASSPHIGSTWSVSANQDGIGRTIIGTACQGRVMYFENSGDINIPNNTLTVGKSITSSGNSYTYKTGGGGTAKQVIVGQTTATTSGVAKKVAYVGHTHSLVIYVWATQSTSSGVSVIANITTSYGSSTGGVTQSSGAMGTVSAVAVGYNNGGSPGYTIDITVTYSGAAPTINYVIEGISHDNAIYTL